MEGWDVRVCPPGEDDVVVHFDEEEGSALSEFLWEMTMRQPGTDIYVQWPVP